MISEPEQNIDSEEILLETARLALSQCNWVVGRCASEWTQKYASGRTDADFGQLIGLSADQVFQRRRVWETFHDVYGSYPSLKWSHFYVSINWEDAAECLQWAVENQATVAEMRAWRRAIHGEDLTTSPDEHSLQALDFSNAEVRAATDFSGPADLDIPFDANQDYETVGSGNREQTPYAPFRKDARGPGLTGGDYESGPSDVTVGMKSPSAQLSPLRIVKRAISGLKRVQQQLAELSAEDYHDLTPDVINELWELYDQIGQEIKHPN